MTDAIRDDNHVTVALGVSSASATTTLPFKIDSATGRLLTTAASGSGDVVGPASSTDTAIARFDGATGILLQDSAVLVADTTGDVTEIGNITGTSGDMTITGGTASGNDLILASTSNGTKGNIDFGTVDTNSGMRWDEVNERLSIGGDENTITIGGTPAGSALTVHTEGASQLYQVAWERHSDTAAFAPITIYGRSRGTETTETVVADGDALGKLLFIGHDGTDFERAAEISVEVDGTPGAGDMPGRMIFSVTPDGSATPAEAMRISNDKVVQLASLTASEIVLTDASKNLVSAAVATYPSLAELIHVKGVTSAIQTQLDGKSPTAGNTSLVTVGALDAGSITSNFGNIDNGSSTLDTGALTATTGVFTSTMDITGDTTIGVASPNDVQPVFQIRGDADSDAGGDTTEVLQVVLTPAADPTAATWDFTSTQSAGYTFDKDINMSGDLLLGTGTGNKSSIILNPSALADESWSGTTIKGTGGATIAVGDLVYLLAADSEWYLSDGILDGTDDAFKNMIGVCVLASSDGNPIEVLVDGLIASAAFPAFTVGAPVYMDDTAGDMVVAQPSTTNFAIRVVGYALTATVIHFRPSADYIVHI